MAILWLLSGCAGSSEDNPIVVPPSTRLCSTPVFKATSASVFRCPERGQFTIEFENGLRIEGLSFQAQIDDRLLTSNDWTQAAWRSSQGKASLILSGRDDALVASIDVKLRGAQVMVSASIDSPTRRLIDSVGFGAMGPGKGIMLEHLQEHRVWPTNAGRPIPVNTSFTRLNEQLIFSRGQAVYLGRGLTSTRLRLAVEPPTADGYIGIEIKTGGPIRVGPDAPGQVFVVATTARTQDGALAKVKEGYQASGATVSLPPVLWGWRPGPEHEHDLSVDSIAEVSAKLAEWSTDSVYLPSIWLDEDWYTALGDWTWRPGLSSLAQKPNLLPLAVTWPAFRVEGSPPEGIPTDSSKCGDQACLLIRPTAASTWSWIQQQALELAQQGLSGARLVDLPADLNLQYTSDLQTLSETFDGRIIAEARHEFLGSIGYLARPIRSRAEQVLCMAPTQDCPPSTDMTPNATRLAKGLEGAAVKAWWLSQHWHWSSLSRLDAGPVYVSGMPEGTARIHTTLGAMSGVYLLTDPIDTISPEAEEIALAPIRMDVVTPTRPHARIGLYPPAVWTSPFVTGIINWSDATLTLDTLPSPLPPNTEWFDVYSGSRIDHQSWSNTSIPPGDALLLKRMSSQPVGEGENR